VVKVFFTVSEVRTCFVAAFEEHLDGLDLDELLKLMRKSTYKVSLRRSLIGFV
jgi:hypothetical protein